MPSSTVSLEPLSSPSPSPPPPEPISRSSNSNHSGAAAGLDSGSELSELTDDDQENEDLEDEDERPRPTRRKKRGGIVPAPMWDWAYKKSDSTWRTKPIEEEEEEELAGPAEAMEEEEDEGFDGGDTPDGNSPAVHANKALPVAPEDGEDEPEEEDPPEDEDDVPEGDDDQSVLRATSRPLHEVDVPSDDGEVDPSADLNADDAPPSRMATRRASPELSDDENVEEEQVDVDAGVDDDEPQDPELGAELDNDTEIADTRVPNDTSTGNTPAPIVSIAVKVNTATAAVTVTKKAEPEVSTTPMDVDDDTPVVAISPIAVAVAHSSIMAGADVVAPPSPSSSSSSASGSARASVSPSRSPSAEPVSDRELDAKTSNGRVHAKGKGTIIEKPHNARLTRNRSRRKTKTHEGLEQDGGDASRLGAEGDDRDLVDTEDLDIDSPDLELESDVLPVHRAEALDVLAQIELKFALLREKLYVEKMEGLAWEEALIVEDNHPEMLHLQAELDKRRNKRLDLAARRRDFEVANITKRRKLDEDGVWSWWKSARDDLQAEMTSETNRRRRKLDRERRNFDRPQPTRVVPGPPLEVSVPPTVYEIVKADPFNTSRSSKSRKHQLPSRFLVYPQLASLTQDEVLQDIDFIFRPRSVPYDVARQGMMGPGPVIGHPLGVPTGYDPFGMIVDGSGMSRYGPGPPPMQHLPHPHQHLPPGFPGPSNVIRMPSHVAPQPIPHPMMMDIDSGAIRRPSSVPGLPNHQPFPHSGPSVPINLMRRSISPVPAYTNGQASVLPGPSSSFGGPRPQGWMTEGVPGPSLHAVGAKDRRLNGNDHNGFDREKNRDRAESLLQKDRNEREHEERENHFMQQHAPPRHASHTHSHTHIHGTAQNSHRGHRHVTHHHHVLHHHHPTNGAEGSGPLPGSSTGDRVNGPGVVSPRMREFDLHRPRSGAPTEVIDLSASSMKQGHQGHPPMPAFWKGSEDQPPSATDGDRGRSSYNGSLSSGPLERVALPSFGMGYPSPPRHGPSTAPGSRAPSRRGSFSAMDDSGPRPSSSHSMGPMASNHPPITVASPTLHRPTLNNPGGRLQTSPNLQPQHSVMVSPRSNGIRLPPISPSNASSTVGNIRSPIRMNQALPPPPLPPSHSHSHSQSGSKPTSPLEMRRRTPPPPHARPPPNREPPSHAGHPRTSSPMVMLPPPSSLQQPRLPPVSLSEKHSPNLPKMKAQAVPIDGS